MANKITKYGTIKGGVCDQLHRHRYDREQGATWYINFLLSEMILVCTNGWWRVTKDSGLTMKKIAEIGAGRGAEWQNGLYRVKHEIFDRAYDEGRAFRLSFVQEKVMELCSFLFEMGKGYSSSHYPSIYKAKKEAGELDNE